LNSEIREPNPLKQFTEANSFRLCTEGLRALELFERQASPDQLRIAESKLEECVRLYPGDVIPKFYLGTVKTLMGYSGLDKAVELLKEVAQTGSDDLRAAAQFNLAVAYIERYNREGFAKADQILSKLTTDPSAATGTRRRMIWLARVNQLYIRADLTWRAARKMATPEDIGLAETAPALREEFQRFKTDLDKSQFATDADILADYWNALGTLSEAQAYFDQGRKSAFAGEALQDYLTALQYKVNWVDATSNLARFYQEVLDDPKRAEELWNKVLTTLPDYQYAYYNLGRLEQSRGNLSLAREHFLKAPDIEGAQKALHDLPSD
jgi:tetratricopeptide (TPR) repeat protein